MSKRASYCFDEVAGIDIATASGHEMARSLKMKCWQRPASRRNHVAA